MSTLYKTEWRNYSVTIEVPDALREQKPIYVAPLAADPTKISL